MSSDALTAAADSARDDLRRAADVYRRVTTLVLDTPGPGQGRGRAGKPTSNPPKGTDYPLRSALVASARHLAYAHHLLADLGAPGRWWQPHPDTAKVATLGRWHIPYVAWLDFTVDDRDGTPTVVARPRHERPVWTPEASDLAVAPVDPPVFDWAAERVEAGLSWAVPYALDIHQVCRYAHWALSSLRHVEKVKRIVRGDTGEADWTDPLLMSIVACDNCNDQGVCSDHTPDLEVAFECGDLQVVEVWQGAELPRDYPRAHERCGHAPGCYRLRKAGQKLCGPCANRTVPDCATCGLPDDEDEPGDDLEARRTCVHCREKPPAPHRAWCERCRRGHQADRMSCTVCGLNQKQEAS